jgi:hypothetical protein
MKRIPADRLRAGDTIVRRKPTHDLHVIQVSSNSLGDVVARCAFSPDAYPATSLLLKPDELVLIRSP